ncbi:MAG TPA: tripartite tricarboxylate transporter substrate binding protein [Burkholderiales bacterium]|jgi:tripartite-type tricarboxylate transporter receptor subunit TctC
MDRRKFLHTTLATGIAGAPAIAPLRAFAQANKWPDRPMRWVVAQPAGSGVDVVARVLTEKLSTRLGQNTVIDNKPGGQNLIGAQTAKNSAPDGYTFYFATSAALVSNLFLFKSLPYDPRADFTPVEYIASSPFGVFTRADGPIESMKDLLARAKADPEKISIANEGPRTLGGIISRLLNARAGIKANLVAYTSVNTAITDAIGGQTDAVVSDLASAAQLTRQGKLRLLCVTSPKRVTGWEQTPALAELLPGYSMIGFFGLVAPKGTPAPIVKRMSDELTAILSEKDVAERILTIGPIAEPGGPARLAAFLAGERKRWAEVSKTIGLLPE